MGQKDSRGERYRHYCHQKEKTDDDDDNNNSRESSPSSTLVLDPALLRNRSPASSSKPSQKSSRYYTVDDVSKHDRENDCWVIVHDRVYDVTTFVPKHPGGNMIRVNAGGECTALFESYHPPKARAVLEKFYIGDVVEEEEEKKKKKKKKNDNNNNSETTTKSERMKAPKYREIG